MRGGNPKNSGKLKEGFYFLNKGPYSPIIIAHVEEKLVAISPKKGIEELSEASMGNYTPYLDLDKLERVLDDYFGELEERARGLHYKYESRLAASLRDLCHVQELGEFSCEQMNYFTGATLALIKEWGTMDKERLNNIRTPLLDIGLTWLPVTKKAEKQILKSKAEGSA